jgi:hypothetical protein
MTVDLNKITKAYLRLRDQRDELRRTYTDQDNVLKEKQERLEAAALAFLNETGQESARTVNGTVYRQEDVIPTGSDWERFYEWVKENDAFDALERRIKKGFVASYMEEHEGAPPPGVSVLRRYVVRVRRS